MPKICLLSRHFDNWKCPRSLSYLSLLSGDLTHFPLIYESVSRTKARNQGFMWLNLNVYTVLVKSFAHLSLKLSSKIAYSYHQFFTKTYSFCTWNALISNFIDKIYWTILLYVNWSYVNWVQVIDVISQNVTMKNLEIKVAFLLGKSVCLLSEILYDFEWNYCLEYWK